MNSVNLYWPTLLVELLEKCFIICLIYPALGKNDTMPVTGWVKAVELCVVSFLPEEAVREARNTYPDVALLRP